jgi:protein-S-isoprenylcysteine O-methyltransferase Ste14
MSNKSSGLASALDAVLLRPAIDRAIGIVAVSPFAYSIWTSLQERPLPIESLLLSVELVILAITMVTRRPAVRVTHNPLFWALAFAATYWSFMMQTPYESGHPVAPREVSVSIAVIGLAVSIWARLSLGRNIGFVPAERRIVTTGAYAYVRHPIYTGLFISIVALDLSAFSWRNVGLDLVWVGLWVAKTLAEEHFLKDSAEYAAYTKRVRKRWLPWVA